MARELRAIGFVLLLLLVLIVGGLPSARPSHAAAGTDVLNAEEGLTPGQVLVSPNGLYTAAMQGDGNFVVYGPRGVVEFATGTAGRGKAIYLYESGNLSVGGGAGPVWQTGTLGGSAHLFMQNDGNLVLYMGPYQSGTAVWSSRTGLIVSALEGPSQLGAGEWRVVGQALVSPDRRYHGVMRPDGSFVVYGPTGTVQYSTPTTGSGSDYLVMQGDGNLVLYAGSVARWATSTSGASAFLALQNDGNLVVYAGGRAAWSSRTGFIPAPATVVTTLKAGDILRTGYEVDSPDGRYRAVLQGDGNFVVYAPGGVALFSSGTSGTPNAWLAMQSDGNLVLYSGGTARWQSATTGASAVLAMQNDGNLVVYASGRATWSSRYGRVPVPAFAGTGTFVVGTQIAPGTYRTRSAPTAVCAWERLSGWSGTPADVAGSRTTAAPDVVTILPTDVGFRTRGCDAWSTDLSPLTTSLTAHLTGGTYIVGVDIEPGLWLMSDGWSCTWQRLRAFTGRQEDIVLAVSGPNPYPVVESSDVGFWVDPRCGTWTKGRS